MHAAQLQTALCHHPAGNGRIDTAAQQQHTPTRGAGGQTACTGDGAAVNKGVILPNLHPDGDLRLFHLRLQMGKHIAEVAAHFPADLGRGQGEALVGALGLHLIGADTAQQVFQIQACLFLDVPDVLFTHHGAAHAHQTEHPAADLHGLVHGSAFILRLHVEGGLAAVDLEIAHLFQPPVQGLLQTILKFTAVQALEHQLAALTKQNFSHNGYTTFTNWMSS